MSAGGDQCVGGAPGAYSPLDGQVGAALVASALEGETTVQRAARKHGVMAVRSEMLIAVPSLYPPLCPFLGAGWWRAAPAGRVGERLTTAGRAPEALACRKARVRPAPPGGVRYQKRRQGVVPESACQ